METLYRFCHDHAEPVKVEPLVFVHRARMEEKGGALASFYKYAASTGVMDSDNGQSFPEGPLL